MGLSFDGNGRYVGWSNLFDYSSLETIMASEKLPMPQGKTFIKATSGTNISEYLERLKEADAVERLEIYSELLNDLYKNSKDKVRISLTFQNDEDTDLFNEVVSQLNLHEHTNIPANLRENASKNFISSRILSTVQNLRNMIAAYTPVEMEDFRAASENSPKGNESLQMTMLNPATKLLMLIQNITGKNVTGITANAMKASFMWHYYINDVIRNLNEDDFNYINFSFKTSRIHQRSKGNPVEQEINTLPDVNFEDSLELFNRWLPNRIQGNIPVDSMNSEFMSASTDNAKELILAKVNAGNKLAKMHLFLITLGFDVNDIVKFMTSPVVEFIDSVTDSNIFLNYDLKINDAIDMAKGNYSSLVPAEFASFLEQKPNGKELLSALKNGLLSLINNQIQYVANKQIKTVNDVFTTNESDYYVLRDIVTLIESIKNRLKYNINDAATQADIAEFENVLEGAEEFSYLGRALGINLGIKGVKHELQTQNNLLKQAYDNRVNKSKNRQAKQLIMNPLLFLTDPQYAKEIMNNYNSVKKCVNIFSLINHIPHFKAMYDLLAMVNDIDHVVPEVNRIVDAIYTDLTSKGKQFSEDFLKNLISAVQVWNVSVFINSLKDSIKIPYPKGTILLNEDRSLSTAVREGLLTLDSRCNIATFKKLFEDFVLDFSQGRVYDVNGYKTVDKLRSNKFILSLIPGNDGDTPIIKCDLNMNTYENSPDTKRRFDELLAGLKDLNTVTINGIKLSDLFFLYNLITNQNHNGADRFTKLFEAFIQDENSKIILNYFKYIGNLDYSADIDLENNMITNNYNGDTASMSIYDLMIAAAPIVRSFSGQKDPFVKMNTPRGIVVYGKSQKEYVPIREMIPDKKNESPALRQTRIYNEVAYFTLGGAFTNDSQLKMETINKIATTRDLETLLEIKDVILNLWRDGLFTVLKIC